MHYCPVLTCLYGRMAIGHKIRILIVEDHWANRKLLEEMPGTHATLLRTTLLRARGTDTTALRAMGLLLR
eukprot:420355-Rhodomonas_salina.1